MYIYTKTFLKLNKIAVGPANPTLDSLLRILQLMFYSYTFYCVLYL